MQLLKANKYICNCEDHFLIWKNNKVLATIRSAMYVVLKTRSQVRRNDGHWR